MQREVTPIFGKKKAVLRETPRAVTPFGGLSVFIEFLGKIGYRQQVSEHMPVHLKSPNAIDPGERMGSDPAFCCRAGAVAREEALARAEVV